MFDCRAFNVPQDEVVNAFLWRQQDCTRNSIQTLARTMFSHKQLHGANTSKMQDMMMVEKGVNWNKQTTRFKRGIAVYNAGAGWVADYEAPIFTKDREYIERWVRPVEEGKDVSIVGFGDGIMDEAALGFKGRRV